MSPDRGPEAGPSRMVSARYHLLESVDGSGRVLDATSRSARVGRRGRAVIDWTTDSVRDPGDERFDAVACLDLPADEAQIRTAVQQLRRWCAPSGLLIVGIDDPRSTMTADRLARVATQVCGPDTDAVVLAEWRGDFSLLADQNRTSISIRYEHQERPPTGYVAVIGASPEPHRFLDFVAADFGLAGATDESTEHELTAVRRHLREAELLLERLPLAEEAIQELQWYRDRLDALTASISWRVTKPLRYGSTTGKLAAERMLDKAMKWGGSELIRRASDAVAARFRR